MHSPPSRIHELAIAGDVAGLEAFLAGEGKGADLNERDSYGFAPLHLATDRGALWTLLAESLNKTLMLSRVHRSRWRGQGPPRSRGRSLPFCAFLSRIHSLSVGLSMLITTDAVSQDEDGNTALDLARLAEHDDLVALLS